ncbi:sugar kinase [Blastomonas sp.]|uniref:sugar kinase n=1 Tax=Blastomonas sp. TaxID=1909299 RepID=UPI002614757F|nr:sugar kinase [Blastomonas sp.]MDM7957537.1 sugar kinase [Blastomonas sp.]
MTVFVFGEAMLEFHGDGGEGLRYGGDTLNTAIHLARDGHDVAYVTALGMDAISDAMIAAWQAEGIDTRFVLRHPTRNPGIYAIHVDNSGERSFLYWRDQSAARAMFELPGMAAALKAAEQASLLYFSLISLAILPEAGRAALLGLADAVRSAGGQVAYDSNFRRNLWPSIAVARDTSWQAVRLATIGLPTNVDERQLQELDLTVDQIGAQWLAHGCADVVIKAGEQGCYHFRTGVREHFAAERAVVVDSSGAGDAFNAGFLSAYLKGHKLQDAVSSGQALARRVIGKRGALPAE